MDDDVLRNTFTVGTGDNTLSVSIAQPGAGQMMILAMSRTGTNTGEMSRLVSRILRVIEVLAGSDWDKIEDAMLTESIDPLEFMDLAKGVLMFDWDALAKRQEAEKSAPEPVPEPGEVAEFLAKHVPADGA